MSRYRVSQNKQIHDHCHLLLLEFCIVKRHIQAAIFVCIVLRSLFTYCYAMEVLIKLVLVDSNFQEGLLRSIRIWQGAIILPHQSDSELFKFVAYIARELFIGFVTLTIRMSILANWRACYFIQGPMCPNHLLNFVKLVGNAFLCVWCIYGQITSTTQFCSFFFYFDHSISIIWFVIIAI